MLAAGLDPQVLKRKQLQSSSYGSCCSIFRKAYLKLAAEPNVSLNRSLHSGTPQKVSKTSQHHEPCHQKMDRTSVNAPQDTLLSAPGRLTASTLHAKEHTTIRIYEPCCTQAEAPQPRTRRWWVSSTDILEAVLPSEHELINNGTHHHDQLHQPRDSVHHTSFKQLQQLG